jgi:hypothetical protein
MMNSLDAVRHSPGLQIINSYQELFLAYSDSRALGRPTRTQDFSLTTLNQLGLTDASIEVEEVPQSVLLDVGKGVYGAFLASQEHADATAKIVRKESELANSLLNLMHGMIGQFAVVTALHAADNTDAIRNLGGRWHDKRRYLGKPVNRAEGIVSSTSTHDFTLLPEGRLSRLTLRGYRVEPVDFYSLEPQVEIDI